MTRSSFGSARLRVVAGGSTSTEAEYALDRGRGRAVLGRDPSCDIVLRSEFVSRRHAALTFRSEGWYVEDLGSTHGTVLNGGKVTQSTMVADGSRIKLADITLTYTTTVEPSADEAVTKQTTAARKPELASAYVRASEAFESGDYAKAQLLLREHLAESPSDIPGHFALGMSAAETGDNLTAEREFRWVLQASPRHHVAAYRLGIVLQALGRFDDSAAAFRQALAIVEIPDARARLAAVTASPPASAAHLGGRLATASPQPASVGASAQTNEPLGANDKPADKASLRSLAADLDERNDTSPGPVQMDTVRSLRSFGVSWVLVVALLTAGVVALIRQDQLGNLAIDSGWPRPATSVSAVISLIFLCAGALLLSVFARAFVTRYVVFERRIEVTGGLVHRSKRLVWCHDITDLTYTRSLSDLLTNSAGLVVEYDGGGPQPKSVSIRGAGTARDTERLYARLQETVMRERRAMKKQFL